MRSQELYNYFIKAIDKEFNGNVSPDTFCVFYNARQLTYMDFCIGNKREYRVGQGVARNSPEMSAAAMAAVAPFWKKRFAVPVTNGRAHVNQGDFMGAYRLFVPGWQNPECGSGDAPDRWEIPVEEIPQQEWSVRSNPKRYNTPTIEQPGFTQVEDGDVLVLPLSITSLWATYLRTPRPITIATLPDGSPDPFAQNDDPEWNDTDAMAILYDCIGDAGIREQVQSWVQFSDKMRAGQ